MGHSEKFCPKLFEISEQLIEKPYGLWMRAMPKKNLGRIGEKWLRSRVTESRNAGDGGSRGEDPGEPKNRSQFKTPTNQEIN